MTWSVNGDRLEQSCRRVISIQFKQFNHMSYAWCVRCKDTDGVLTAIGEANICRCKTADLVLQVLRHRFNAEGARVAVEFNRTARNDCLEIKN